MLLGLGFLTKNTIWFQRPLHLLISSSSSSLHYFHTNLKNNSSTSSSLSECDEDFLPWLRAKSGVDISSVLSIGNSIYGRSLFASEYIQAGDSILKVPFSVHLTPDNILPEINSLLSNVVGDVSRLAIVVLMEQRKGQASEWDPYISSLPHAGELHSTLFWSKEELEMIHQSSVYEETISQKAQLKKEYLTLRPALDQFPIFFKDTTFEDFLHAFVLVASRAWGSSKAVSLVPFADFLNHDGDSEALLLIDEDKQISEVIADQDYTPGKQVLVSYGKYPNSTLLLDFGFTLSYNNCDQVQIQMVSPQHDPLRNLKLELVHKLSTPVVTDSCSIDSFRNSFIIKEVRSTRGKGKGIPQPLRAFARILCTDTLEELRDLELEALQTDGRLARRPLKNMSREIQSHQLLLSRITHLIQDYDASVKSLKCLSSHCIGGNFALRKQMAYDLLSGELRILRSASAWLENYCSTLSKETIASHYKLGSLDCLQAIE